MKTFGASSGRWTAVVAIAACAVLALSLGSAAAKPGKCKPKAEAAGCKLPEGARFYKKSTPSSSITVQVGKKGASVDLFGVPIKCKEFAPLLGDESYVQIGLDNTQRPKVGKSYTLKETETQVGEEGEGTSTSSTEVTLNFKTAQLVVVKIHQRSETDGKVGCDGGATYNVKRQS